MSWRLLFDFQIDDQVMPAGAIITDHSLDATLAQSPNVEPLTSDAALLWYNAGPVKPTSAIVSRCQGVGVGMPSTYWYSVGNGLLRDVGPWSLV